MGIVCVEGTGGKGYEEEKKIKKIKIKKKGRSGDPSKRTKLYIHRKKRIERKKRKRPQISREPGKSAVTCISLLESESVLGKCFAEKKKRRKGKTKIRLNLSD